jgi:hypothetical protein
MVPGVNPGLSFHALRGADRVHRPRPIVLGLVLDFSLRLGRFRTNGIRLIAYEQLTL